MNRNEALTKLSETINEKYGFEGKIPRINYGPCGIFSYLFYWEWKKQKSEEVTICFALTKDLQECDHIFLMFEDGTLFDGGVGIHSLKAYESFFVVKMCRYDERLLDEMAYGLDRVFPRFCPMFDQEWTRRKIREALEFLKVGEL